MPRMLFVIFLLANAVNVFAQEKLLKSEHFILNCPCQDSGLSIQSNVEQFCRDTLHQAELYYQHIADQLGYRRSSDFWTWEKRVKIKLFKDKASFLSSGPHPEWAAGVADYQSRTITSFVGSDNFITTILAHEIAHLIFRDFIGFSNNVPSWLDEGVAQWTEQNKRNNIRQLVAKMYQEDKLLSIEDMMHIDPSKITLKENVYIRRTKTKDNQDGVLFLTSEALINAYYIQAVSLVDFLIERFGKNDFAEFCRQLRDGKTVEEALVSAYGVYLRTLADLEEQWRNYIASGIDS